MSSRARWEYGDTSLEFEAFLRHRGRRYRVPTYSGEGWAHAYMKAIIAAHLLNWGYGWGSILWEHDPPHVPGKLRADIFAVGRGRRPTFWFECRATDMDKLRKLRRLLEPAIRIVHVQQAHWFLRWWNGENRPRDPSLSPARRRAAIRRWRARHAVPGVEYWAVQDSSSSSARLLFAVRAEGKDRYTYFDTGEGWSMSWIAMLSRRTDCWAPLIPSLAGNGGRDSLGKCLPRKIGT